MTTLKISKRVLNNLIKKLSVYTHYYNLLSNKTPPVKARIDLLIRIIRDILYALSIGKPSIVISEEDKKELNIIMKSSDDNLVFNPNGDDSGEDLDSLLGDTEVDTDFFQINKKDRDTLLKIKSNVNKIIEIKEAYAIYLSGVKLIKQDLITFGMNVIESILLNPTSNIIELKRAIQQNINTKKPQVNEKNTLIEALFKLVTDDISILDKPTDITIAKYVKEFKDKATINKTIVSESYLKKKQEIEKISTEAINELNAQADILFLQRNAKKQSDEAQASVIAQNLQLVKDKAIFTLTSAEAQIEIIKKATRDIESEFVKIINDITIENLRLIEVNIKFNDKLAKEAKLQVDALLLSVLAEAKNELDIKTRFDAAKDNAKLEELKEIAEYEKTEKAINVKIREITEKSEAAVASEAAAAAKKRAETTKHINLESIKEYNSDIFTEIETLKKTLKDENDKGQIDMITTNNHDPYRNHPFPEVIQLSIFGKGAATEDATGSLKGGDIQAKALKSLIFLPNIWLKEHQKLYRDPNLLKLLSLKPETIKEIVKTLGTNPGLTGDTRIHKLLVLILFWDIQDLEKKLSQLPKDQTEKYKNLLLNIQENNNIIKKFVDFSIAEPASIKQFPGNTTRFVLTEDLIRFYKIESEGYIKKNIIGNEIEDSKLLSSSSSLSVILYSSLIQDYIHWKQTETNFKQLLVELVSVKDKIDEEYNKLNDESVKTYLKIRCDDDLYNQYYNIYIKKDLPEQNLQSLFIAGPDPNLKIPFYKPRINNTDILNISKQKELGISLKMIAGPENGTLDTITRYDYGYLYGPFTRIFPPKDTNDKVSKNCNEIIDMITHNKSVFVIGYGQSGAGKTSYMISRKYRETDGSIKKIDGIILELLKQPTIRARGDIIVSIKELYKVKNNIISYDDISFKYDAVNNNYKLDDASSNDKSGKYRQVNKFKINGKIEFKEKEYDWEIRAGYFYHTKLIEGGEEDRYDSKLKEANGHFNSLCDSKKINLLSDFISVLVDDIRMVRPTPNNRQSSRSHVLVFFKFGTGNYLVLGDLAGVENRFLCTDPKTKKEFSNLKLPLEPKLTYYVENPIIEFSPIANSFEEKILRYYNYTEIENIKIDDVNNQDASETEIKEYEEKIKKYEKEIQTKNLLLNYCYEVLTDADIIGKEKAKIGKTGQENITQHSVKSIIDNIFEKIKYVFKRRIVGKTLDLTISGLIDKKFEIDYNYNELRYKKSDEINIDFVNSKVNILGESERDKKTFIDFNKWFPVKCQIERYSQDDKHTNLAFRIHKTTKGKIIITYNDNQIMRIIDIINYPNKRNEGLFEHDGTFIRHSGPAIRNFTFKNTGKYMPYITSTLGTDLNTDIQKRINNSSENFNIEKLETDLKTIKDENDKIKKIITPNKEKGSFDLTKIYNIFNESDNTFLDTLSLPDLELYYNNILSDKIKYELYDDAHKIELIQKYFIEIPKIQLGLTDDVISSKFKTDLDKILEKNAEISKTILSNIEVYFRLIKKNCIDRAEEGEFINRTLYGMRKNISEITKKNNRQYALFQKIPIFNSACLEYYCNSELYNCFNIPKDYYTSSQYDTSIFDTINSKIQLTNSNELNIAIFGVINISRNVNDPPSMPYFNLTNLKQIRDILHTNWNYNYLPTIRTKEDTNINVEIEKITTILKIYENSISKTLYNLTDHTGVLFDIISSITTVTGINQKYIQFIKLINILEEINSVSLLGTLDFLNSVKNSLQTDISCDIINLDTKKKGIAIKDLTDYKNLMTDTTILNETAGNLIEFGKDITPDKSIINEYISLLQAAEAQVLTEAKPQVLTEATEAK